MLDILRPVLQDWCNAFAAVTNVIGHMKPFPSAGYLAPLSVCLLKVSCMSTSSCMAFTTVAYGCHN